MSQNRDLVASHIVQCSSLVLLCTCRIRIPIHQQGRHTGGNVGSFTGCFTIHGSYRYRLGSFFPMTILKSKLKPEASAGVGGWMALSMWSVVTECYNDLECWMYEMIRSLVTLEAKVVCWMLRVFFTNHANGTWTKVFFGISDHSILQRSSRLLVCFPKR